MARRSGQTDCRSSNSSASEGRPVPRIAERASSSMQCGGLNLRVLLVEDDVLLGTSTKVGLEQDGYAVDWVKDAEAADRALTTHVYDAVVLDLGSRHGRRDAAARLARPRRAYGGSRSDRSRIRPRPGTAPQPRADDYLVKPFDLTELDARVRAVVRRAAGVSCSALTVGHLQ